MCAPHFQPAGFHSVTPSITITAAAFGHQWSLATHIEEVAPDAMNRRAAEWAKQMAG